MRFRVVFNDISIQCHIMTLPGPNTFSVCKSNALLYLTNENMACVVLVGPFISRRTEKNLQIKLSRRLKSPDRPNLLAASSAPRQHGDTGLIEILMTCLF